MSEPEQRARGNALAEISNGAVRLLAEYTGRGPTKAHTTINRDSVMILLGDTLTKAERRLAETGEGSIVLQMRHRFQEAMRHELIALVETHTQRKVLAFMSANHIDPDMAVEVFVLEAWPDSGEDDVESDSGR